MTIATLGEDILFFLKDDRRHWKKVGTSELHLFIRFCSSLD